MMSSKKYYWLKMEKDFFSQKEIRKLRRIAGGDTYTIIYLKMSLLSLENDGALFFEGVEDNFIEELAYDLGEEADNVEVTVAFLKAHNMLEEVTEDEYYLNRIPEMTGKETESAKKMRRLRARNKEVGHNVTEVLPDVIESDTEKELEKEKDKEIELKKNIIIPDNLTDDLKEALNNFIEYRKERKPKWTQNSLNMTIKRIGIGKEFSSEEHLIECIEQSIMNGYQGIFGNKKGKANNKGVAKDESVIDRMIREEKEKEMRGAEIVD